MWQDLTEMVNRNPPTIGPLGALLYPQICLLLPDKMGLFITLYEKP